MWPLALSMFMTNSTLLWWTLEATSRNQAESCKGGSAMEI